MINIEGTDSKLVKIDIYVKMICKNDIYYIGYTTIKKMMIMKIFIV